MGKATFALIHNPGCPGYWHEIVKAKTFDAVANKVFGRNQWSRILQEQGQIFCPRKSGTAQSVHVVMLFNGNYGGDIDTIVFKGMVYPIAYVELADGTEVPVSSSALQDALLDAEGRYVSAEARWVDEQIACFMPDMQNASYEQVLAFAEECYA